MNKAKKIMVANIEEFEEHFERVLNDYWENLTKLEKERYIFSFHTSLTQAIVSELRNNKNGDIMEVCQKLEDLIKK